MIEVDEVTLGYGARRFVTAVDGASLSIGHNEIIVGVAGESGSGKSALMRAIYGDFSTGLRLTAGSITATFPGRKPIDCRQMRQTWWEDISYVPQGSMGVLNPLMKVHKQLVDGLPGTSDAATGARSGATWNGSWRGSTSTPRCSTSIRTSSPVACASASSSPSPPTSSRS